MAITLSSNSWVDLDRASELTEERVDLVAFAGLIEGSTPERAEAALIQAYHSINTLSFFVPSFAKTRPDPFYLQDLSADERALLPSDFLYRVQMAQTLEADHLTGGTSGSPEAYAETRRRAGILEETIGASSTKFAAHAQGDSVLSSRSMQVIAPYLYRSVRIARC
jgi:hypothetical protein